MKTLFIPAKSRAKINPKKILELSKKLPKNIAITYSIQFADIAKEIKNLLKDKKITAFQQVLGCSKPSFNNTDAILLIGSGKFHAISLAYETKLPVFILYRDSLEHISKQDIELIEKKHKAAYLKYLNSNKIGIIVSTKPGQNRLKQALALAKDNNKKYYTFLTNNINRSEFENFDIDSWVNTACTRLDMDSAIINIDKIKP
jgi:diphthamide biosynthesis enzyme Dph1/Dph2-like protein